MVGFSQVVQGPTSCPPSSGLWWRVAALPTLLRSVIGDTSADSFVFASIWGDAIKSSHLFFFPPRFER